MDSVLRNELADLRVELMHALRTEHREYLRTRIAAIQTLIALG